MINLALFFTRGVMITLANIPPMRFNYQQRAGRTGRRDASLSMVLTIGRNRSHDDYYFQNVEKITSDPSPAPYLDLHQEAIIRRVLHSELLRRAFRIVENDPDLGDNVHGQFGKVDSWNNNQGQVQSWLNDHREDIKEVLKALLVQAPADILAKQDKIIEDTIQFLPQEITEVVKSNQFLQPDLSERLANAGLLPMFGFPTKTRNLRRKTKDNRYYPQYQQDEDVVDRDLDIAISQFAPGSEIVKDKRVLTSIGLINPFKEDFDYSPLGQRQEVGVCKNCNAFTTDLKSREVCPICSSKEYKVFTISEPMDFQIAPEDRPYDGYLDWLPKTFSSPYVSSVMAPIEDWISFRYARVWGGTRQQIFLINDNKGNLFTFNKAKKDNRLGLQWFSKGSIAGIYSQDIEKANTDENTAPVSMGLASIKTTDILFAGINLPAEKGFDLNPIPFRGSSAWLSYGYFLRNTIAGTLDIDRKELNVGIRVVRSGAEGVFDGEVYIADSLENGAGYAAYFNDKERFQNLLEQMLDNNKYNLASHNKMLPCDGSCYACLQDYGNMMYHSRLDWRLSMDMVQLANDGQINIDQNGWADWYSYSRNSVDNFCRAFKNKHFELKRYGKLWAASNNEMTIITVHPLWQTDPNKPWTPELYEAVDEVQKFGYLDREKNPKAKYWVLVNWFDLYRRPFSVISSLRAR